jgi:dinuclear metal center YbgI/SA1388 family protein
MDMNPTVTQVLAIMERAAPAHLAESWDNPGLQIGYPDHRVQAMIAALDPSVGVVTEAAARGALLIVTHHPLFFRPVSSLTLDTFPGDVVHAAVTHGISLISMHTNLDAAHGGISDVLADMIGLRNVEVLEKSRKEEGIGLGRVGYLKKPEPVQAVLAGIKASLGVQHLKVTGVLSKLIRRVAVVGGAGGGMVSEAADSGADLLLTGDVTHHQAIDALQRGLVVVDGGHFATERAAFARVIQNLASSMIEQGWAVKVYTAEEVDPLTVL